MNLKRDVATFWDSQPCGSADGDSLEEGSREYFDLIERERIEREGSIAAHVDFEELSGKRVLEVGCGIGTDFRRFARSSAEAIGVDLSRQSLSLAKRSLDVYGLKSALIAADGERLPFGDNIFDLVYSWGVIHHSPNPEKVVAEIHRVLAPGGTVLAMVYNMRSLFVFQVWLYYGLLKANPFASRRSLLSQHVESPDTKAFSRKEAASLFASFRRLSVRPMITAYDLRIGRRLFLPRWLKRVVPSRFGWFMVVRAMKSPNT